MELEAAGAVDEGNIYWPRLGLQPCEGPEHTKATMVRTRELKYVRRLYEKDELYDLRTDPQELHNRIDDPGLRSQLAELKDRMLTFYQDTADVVPHTAAHLAELQRRLTASSGDLCPGGQGRA